MRKMLPKGVVILLCVYANSIAVPASNQLQKAFHHQMAVLEKEAKQKTPSLEWGKVVFYFSQEPFVRKSESEEKNNRVSLTLFIPMTSLAENLITYSAQQKGLYEVSLKQVRLPSAGVEIAISYDAQRVVFNYELFDAITLQKGIVLIFYNKQLLQNMQNTLKKNTILQTAQADLPYKIIIDAGHGGHDTGTVGCFDLKEKDITLLVAEEVRRVLCKQGFEVCMIRDRDVFIPLDGRTLRANQEKKPCLFISLHANYAKKEQTSGLEIYCLKDELFHAGDVCLETAMDVMVHQARTALYTQSNMLAECIHKHILLQTSKINRPENRGIKYAVGQVMHGVSSEMPVALIEMGFLSNEKEARLLADASYQSALAEGIYRGIREYGQRIRITR